MYYEYNNPEEQKPSEQTNYAQEPIPTNEFRVEDIGDSAPQEQPAKKEKKKSPGWYSS